MARIIMAGATSQSIELVALDSSSTTGGRLSGLAYNTANLKAYYHRAGASPVAITLATQTVTGAYSSGGFVEIDATNMKGHYRLDVPDAAFSAGVPFVTVTLYGATNLVQTDVEIQLTSVNLQDSVRGGMTALPNANAEAAGGLYTRGTGAGQINQPSNGRIDSNVLSIAGTTQTARDIGASVLLSSGTGTGQISLASGAVTTGTNNDKTGYSLTAAYDAAKTAAQPGNEMDILSTTEDTIVDKVWDELLTGATHNINNSSGRRLRQLASNIIYSGTVVSTTENVVELDSGASSQDGAYDPGMLVLTSGNGVGQCRGIYQYEGATRKATIDRDWKVNPQSGDEYMILAWNGREHVNEGMCRGGTINTVTLNANASSFDNAYVGQVIFLRAGLGADQSCRIISYNSTTKVATIAKTWYVIPDVTTSYVILPTAILDLDVYAQMISTKVWANVDRQLTAFGFTVDTNSDGDIVAIKAKTDNLPIDPASETNVNEIPTNPLLTNDSRLNNLDATISSRLASASYTTPPTVNQIVDGTWNEQLSEHLDDGSTGAALNASGGGVTPQAIWEYGNRTLSNESEFADIIAEKNWSYYNRTINSNGIVYVTASVLRNGDCRIYRGDFYSILHNHGLIFESVEGWPQYVQESQLFWECEGVIGVGRLLSLTQIGIELTSEQSLLLPVGQYPFKVYAIDQLGHKRTFLTGNSYITD